MFWTSTGVVVGTDQALAILETTFGSSDLPDLAAYKMGWQHRVSVNDGDEDCFVAKRASRIEIVVTNLIFS